MSEERGQWLRRHRTVVLVLTTVLLGVFVPIPGYVIAALFWPSGVHDLVSTGQGVGFLATVFGVSAVVWAAIAHALLPRRR